MSVYQQLVSVVGAQLREDGFTSPSHAGLLVKPLSGPWRAWISVAGDTFTLDPMAGIMNDELSEIYYRAQALAGKKLERRIDTPPILMVDLERLAADCAACSTKAPWAYRGEILADSVAVDLVDCLRKFAYPFFAKYSSLQSLLDASKERLVGYAFPWFAPLILIKLGRMGDAKTYAANYSRHLPDDEPGAEYRNYFNAVLRLLEPAQLP